MCRPLTGTSAVYFRPHSRVSLLLRPKYLIWVETYCFHEVRTFQVFIQQDQSKSFYLFDLPLAFLHVLPYGQTSIEAPGILLLAGWHFHNGRPPAWPS